MPYGILSIGGSDRVGVGLGLIVFEVVLVGGMCGEVAKIALEWSGDKRRLVVGEKVCCLFSGCEGKR